MNSRTPEAHLESVIVDSACDGVLSITERKAIAHALTRVVISEKDLVGFGFYLAEQASRTSGQNLYDWLRDFVGMARLVRSSPIQQPSCAWFSPGTSIRRVLVDAIASAKRNLAACVYHITDDILVTAVLGAVERGVHLRLITEQSSTGSDGSKLCQILQAVGTLVEVVVVNRSNRRMHHKYLIVDASKVFAGSYNWTNSAVKNDESLCLISDPAQVALFVENFEKIVKRSKARTPKIG
ncbi:MAG: DUF1669 domain-containing protein [Pirellulaceae bacterium]|nr:DUF1669 domain-containing protein [Pirellulaceae bacterium]